MGESFSGRHILPPPGLGAPLTTNSSDHALIATVIRLFNKWFVNEIMVRICSGKRLTLLRLQIYQHQLINAYLYVRVKQLQDHWTTWSAACSYGMAVDELLPDHSRFDRYMLNTHTTSKNDNYRQLTTQQNLVKHCCKNLATINCYSAIEQRTTNNPHNVTAKGTNCFEQETETVEKMSEKHQTKLETDFFAQNRKTLRAAG